METNMSFDHEFFGEPEEVLLNMKHLMFSMRWNNTHHQSQIFWLLTIVNDCFFYFLRQSEPIYAYHALQMAEFYFQSVIMG